MSDFSTRELWVHGVTAVDLSMRNREYSSSIDTWAGSRDIYGRGRDGIDGTQSAKNIPLPAHSLLGNSVVNTLLKDVPYTILSVCSS